MIYLQYAIATIWLYVLLGMLISQVAQVIRTIRNRRASYWIWEREFWQEWWKDMRIGLLWPWLILRRLMR